MLTLEELREFCNKQEEVDDFVRKRADQIYRLREDWQAECYGRPSMPLDTWEVWGDIVEVTAEGVAWRKPWKRHFSFPVAWLFLPEDELQLEVERHLEEKRIRKERVAAERLVKEKQQRIARLERELEALRNDS